MNWSKWIRQTHRWVSIAFTLTVIANFVVMARREPPAWLTYSPLLPLALLLFSGLYLFVLPYLTRWRSGRRTECQRCTDRVAMDASGGLHVADPCVPRRIHVHSTNANEIAVAIDHVDGAVVGGSGHGEASERGERGRIIERRRENATRFREKFRSFFGYLRCSARGLLHAQLLRVFPSAKLGFPQRKILEPGVVELHRNACLHSLVALRGAHDAMVVNMVLEHARLAHAAAPRRASTRGMLESQSGFLRNDSAASNILDRFPTRIQSCRRADEAPKMAFEFPIPKTVVIIVHAA